MRRGRSRLLLAAAAVALVVVAAVGASPATALIAGIPQRETVIGAKSANVTLSGSRISRAPTATTP